MLEKQIERYLCNRVKQLGGLALKFEPPGSGGWPDRIIFFLAAKSCLWRLKHLDKTKAATSEAGR